MEATMNLRITFPGGRRVDAAFGDHVVHTDQPRAAGGEESAPGPYELFLASLGTCAGIYVLGFFQARGLPTEGLSLVERVTNDPKTGRAAAVELEVVLPPGVPEKYLPAIVRAAEQCKVKKTLEEPPQLRVRIAGEPAVRATAEAASAP
jgi:ribosomal protein S12 methylthiotransferase accessory factor